MFPPSPNLSRKDARVRQAVAAAGAAGAVLAWRRGHRALAALSALTAADLAATASMRSCWTYSLLGVRTTPDPGAPATLPLDAAVPAPAA